MKAPDGAGDDVFARAFEHAHEAFIAVDAGGTIVAWNPAAERLYGYSAGEAVGRSLAVLRLPEDDGTGPHEPTARHRHRSGRELSVALRFAPLGLPGGGAGQLLCALDIGDRQQAQRDLEGSRKNLAASRSELRRLARRQAAGEEEARRRVARELHDDFGQRLAAAALELRVAGRELPGDDPRRQGLDAVGASLAELGEDLRRLSHDLHPAALERRGLAKALRDHCAEVERRTGLPVRFRLHGAGDPLPPPFALGLYRIAQEALANVVRHAGARGAEVSLSVDDGSVGLAVIDDGAGFDPAAAHRGLGLASIEERAHLLGGTCRIASAPGAGTEVEVRVPLDEGSAGAASAPADPHPERIGPYRLLEVIGQGPVATVYLAEEPEPLARRLALKLHRGPLPDRRETLRFRAEQQALARLRHPAVAQVYEARTTPEGDLCIALEHVPGIPITAYCDRYRLDLGRRLRLFAEVCGGVRHVHQKGVLHRDLRPANVLVMEEAGVALPKIIGFGGAKGLDRPLTESAPWTPEDLAGDLAYVAPETLAGGESDARSDVYGLGVLLYELLVGTVPVEAGEGGIAELLRAPPAEALPPSRRLRAMAAGAADEVARRRGLSRATRLRRRLAGDLDRVVAKALARDPAARYPTVDALAEEVGRVLQREPVAAGPGDALHQFGRLVRRHRRLVGSAALALLALAAGLAATAVQARRATHEALRADAVARFLEKLFEASDPRAARGEPPDARELLRRGTERLATELHEQPLVRARLLDVLGGIYTGLGLYDEARPLLEQALALRERQLGGHHPDVAATLSRLGSLAHLSGRGDAEPLLRRALAIRERRSGRDDPGVADLLNDLGVALAARGRFDDAEPVMRRALALRERLGGEEDPRTAKLLHNLSGIAYYRGDLRETERLLERSLAIRERTLAEDDPDLAGSREALALLRRQQGRPAEAAALLERLVATAERIYGPDHPALARALLNLGLARRDLGQQDAARQLLERALAIAERTLAPDHPQRLRAFAALAELPAGPATEPRSGE